MGDFALVTTAEGLDMSLDSDDLAEDEGLTTAALLSLGCHRRAEDGDQLPSGDDRRGWFGDELLAPDLDQIGSREWLLERSKATEDQPRRLREFTLEALDWMLEDAVVDELLVEVERGDDGLLYREITFLRAGSDPAVIRPDDPGQPTYVTIEETMTKITPFRAYLEDGGSREAAVDGSSTPAHFDLVPGAGEIMRVDRIVLTMELGAAAAMDEFADLGSALSNGLLLKALWDPDGESPNTELADFLGDYAVTSNRELAEVAEVEFGNGVDGTYALAATFDLRDHDIRLDGDKSAYLRLTVQDDLSSLGSFRAFVVGAREDILS